jgi:hypothetical protein
METLLLALIAVGGGYVVSRLLVPSEKPRRKR